MWSLSKVAHGLLINGVFSRGGIVQTDYSLAATNTAFQIMDPFDFRQQHWKKTMAHIYVSAAATPHILLWPNPSMTAATPHAGAGGDNPSAGVLQ